MTSFKTGSGSAVSAHTPRRSHCDRCVVLIWATSVDSRGSSKEPRWGESVVSPKAFPIGGNRRVSMREMGLLGEDMDGKWSQSPEWLFSSH